jgi:hypothetical protein
MSEAAKLIFGFPVMIDGFATASSVLPVRHFELLDDCAQTLMALRYFDDGGMVFLWGETDSSGEQTFNDTLSGRRAEAVAAYLRFEGVPAAMIQTFRVGSVFASTRARQDAASRRVEIRFQASATIPAPAPVPAVVRPQFQIDRLLPRLHPASVFSPFNLTPTPSNNNTQYGWPGLFQDEDRQTWCQNIANLVSVSDSSGGLSNALGTLCAPIPLGGSHEKFTPPIDQGTGLPNTTIFNLPPWHFNLP